MKYKSCVWFLIASLFSSPLFGLFTNPYVNFEKPRLATIQQTTLYLEDGDITYVSADMSHLIIFEGVIRIFIRSSINQSIVFTTIITFYRNITHLQSPNYSLQASEYEFQLTFPIEFFNYIGPIQLDLVGLRVSDTNERYLFYIGVLKGYIIANPFLVLNIIIFFLFGLIWVLIKREQLNFIPKQSKNTRIASVSSSNTSQMAIRKIICPDCHAKIFEGSAYCSECGYHLALFERYLG
jgi:hypothetical protein